MLPQSGVTLRRVLCSGDDEEGLEEVDSDGEPVSAEGGAAEPAKDELPPFAQEWVIDDPEDDSEWGGRG